MKSECLTGKQKKELILKVKDKFINYDQELQRGNLYNINVDFESYSIDNIEKPVKGYYCKVQGVKKIQFEIYVPDDDSNLKQLFVIISFFYTEFVSIVINNFYFTSTAFTESTL